MRWNPVEQMQDLVNKFGTEERIKRFLSGELMVVERASQVSVTGDNGGITFAKELDIEALLANWIKFYHDVYGMTADLQRIPIPAYQPGFNWGVLVVTGMTDRKVYDEFASLRPCWKSHDDLDAAVPTNDRVPGTTPYLVLCRDRGEADVELKHKSANNIKAMGISTMTLLERQLLGRWFHYMTGGKDLDVENITLCSGSRSQSGRVPGVGRSSGGCVRVCTDYCGTDDAGGSLRARQVLVA